MSKTYVIELPDGSRRVVKAGSVQLHDGHLYASDEWGDAAGQIWAPGRWVGVWKQPDPSWIDAIKLKIALTEKVIEGGYPDAFIAEAHLKTLRAELESLLAEQATTSSAPTCHTHA